MKKILYDRLFQALTACALFSIFLASCDTDGEQAFDFVPGTALTIVGPAEVDAGFSYAYYVEGFTIDKSYTWALDDSSITPTREGEYVEIGFPEPGTYELTVDNGVNQGTQTIIVASVTKQLSFASISGTGMELDTLRVPITISNPTASETTVSYTITGTATAGVDYELLSTNPLVIPEGVSDTTINIVLLDDMLREDPSDAINITINSVTSAVQGEAATVLTDSTELTMFDFTIDDDLKVISFGETETDTLTSTSDAGSYVFDVNLSNAAKADVTIPYTVTGVGVTPLTGTLIFKAGMTSQPLTVALDEAAFAANQEIVLSLDDPVSDDEEVVFGGNEDGSPVGNEMTIVVDVEE